MAELAAVNVIVKVGALAASRVKKRRAVVPADSSPSSSQPKLPVGLSSHDWTSLTRLGVESHTNAVPGILPTARVLLAVVAKSPPALVQGAAPKNRNPQVAVVPSPGAGNPAPPRDPPVP